MECFRLWIEHSIWHQRPPWHSLPQYFSFPQETHVYDHSTPSQAIGGLFLDPVWYLPSDDDKPASLLGE